MNNKEHFLNLFACKDPVALFASQLEHRSL